MSGKTTTYLACVAGFVVLPMVGLFFLLFIFGPAFIVGAAGAAATCSGPPDVSLAATSGGGNGKGDNSGGGKELGFELPKPSGPGEKGQPLHAVGIPPNYKKAYVAAGQRYGLPWQLLAGVGMAESTQGTSPTMKSNMGALGPMQFEPSTWATYGVDGNNDGVKNIWDIQDAAAGTANYLVHLGVRSSPQGVVDALRHYNGTGPTTLLYANDVLRYTWEYATGKVSVVPSGQSGECSNVSVTAGTVNGKILQYAQHWLGTPYQFGGGDIHGPTVGQNSRGDGKLGFDCSGLVLYAVYNATGGKIALPHNAESQYNDHRIQHLTIDQLQPGDLVFLDQLGHIGIYAGVRNGTPMMIDAPHTGAYVRYDSLAPGSHFYNNFVAGGRVIYGSNNKVKA